MIDEGKALMARLRAMAPEKRAQALEAAGAAAFALDECWPLWAHPGQIPDHDDWTVWLALTGRGFGKTRRGRNG